MKTLRFSILGLLTMTAVVCHAQFNNSGWFNMATQPRPTPSIPSLGTNQYQANLLLSGTLQTNNVPLTPIAEAITPQIQALADGLQDNPTNIFDFVHDHIKFVLYFGSKKGAELTLLEKSGNDFDQSALLVALLRAAGYTNVAYQFGWEWLPYDDSSGLNYDLHHWWQLTLNNTNWTNTVGYLENLVTQRGYPAYYDPGDGNDFLLQRMWVALTIGSTTYNLDPAFKISEPVSGISLTNAMGSGSISNTLLSAAGGTDTGNYAQSLNEASVRSQLTTYTTNLLNYIQTNSPNTSVQQILGGWQIVPAYNPYDYTTYTTFSTETFGGTLPVIGWANEPTNIMSTLTITFGGIGYGFYMPQLQGERLSLTFDSGGVGELWLDDNSLESISTASGSTIPVILYAHHPDGFWNFTNNTFINGDYADQTTTNNYQRTNSTYALLYAFEPDWGWLQQRQNMLDTYFQEGLTNTSRQVTSETLNIMGLNWMLQTEQAEDMLAQQLGILPQFFHRLGRMAQETGNGYYVDVYMQLTGEYPSGGDDSAHIQLANDQFDLWSFFASSFENGIIEQLQNSNIVAASTVKMLQIANTNGQAVYLASSTNWTTAYNVQSHLANYNSATLTTIGDYISQGYDVLLPQNGSNHVSSVSGSWAGYGYEARQATNGVATESLMIISGGYNGGYSSDPSVPVNADFVDTSGDNQPTYLDATPVSTPAPTGADPVDMANGTFQIEHTDIVEGTGTAPHGLPFIRYYNSARRNITVPGLPPGWTHNYIMYATNVPAPQACLGGTTPAQAASMLTATAAAIATYNGGVPEPKNWLTTALIAKWGVDQVTKSGVSVVLGKDNYQFVEQPNGVFTPPANCTMTLTQSSSLYSLQERHGRTYQFNNYNYVVSITDQYGQSATLQYFTNSGFPTLLVGPADWNGNGFRLEYDTPAPYYITRVIHGFEANVAAYYRYSTNSNSQTNLTGFGDPNFEGTNTYIYDTNHQIISTLDAQNRLVVSNVYDTQGHITTQYTQGVTNKTWHVYWSGWQTSTVDPAGGETDYLFDDQARLVGVRDALSNLTQTVYDGQNHIVETISPLNETNQYLYDGNNNLVMQIDPLGFTNQFVYDSQNRLTQSVDARQIVTTYGYNAQFSLTGQTNGAGDFVNYAYNTDGTLHTRTDSGGTATYGYDTLHHLSSIAYPNSLGTEYFSNNIDGDVTNHIDTRGFSTAYLYDLARQLTNTIAPSNLVTQTTFDPEENVASGTDARGNVSSFSWSPTRHLLSATLPATVQGTPVLTNLYDSRDWLTNSLDALQQSSYFLNDPNGRVIASTDPLSRTTSFGYDTDGRRTATTNAASETILQTWNARGQMTKFTDGAGHSALYAFDGAGNQTTLTNRNGQVWHFQFDGANRLTATISPLGHSNTVAFNHQGLPYSLSDAAGQVATNGYDAKSRLTNRVDNVGTTVYRYDANDNVTNVSDNGLTNAWTYDAYNRVSTCTDVFGNVIQYHYDGNGNLTNLVYPGGKNVYYAYDSNNRMIGVTDWSGRSTTISYDLDGQMTNVTRPNGTVRSMAYDSAGQMTNILEQMHNGLPIALLRFNWDAAARMQWEFLAPLPHTNTPASRSMAYDNDDRLATVDGNTVSVDSDGNLTSGPLTNDTFATYTYDARNRLLSVGGVTNVYDGMNNRIGQFCGTNSVSYVINPSAKLPQVLMRTKNGITTYYVYGPGLLYQVTETATSTNTLTYHYDSRGSTIALTDDNGLVTDRFEYSAYATLSYRAGSDDTPFLFNGLYGVMTDLNGLLYMRARYYNPFLCRFINPDPSGFAGGMNFYAFGDGNPITETDPFGLESDSTSVWEQFKDILTTGDTWWQRYAYTGEFNPSADVLDQATTEAGAYTYYYGAVRGFFAGAGTAGKLKGGTYMPGYFAGGEVRWTIEGGYGGQLQLGGGLQMRGRTTVLGYGTKPYVSGQIGLSGTYNWDQESGGFKHGSFGGQLYGGQANKLGGYGFTSDAQTVELGITYGNVGFGIVVDPARLVNSFNSNLPIPDDDDDSYSPPLPLQQSTSSANNTSPTK